MGNAQGNYTPVPGDGATNMPLPSTPEQAKQMMAIGVFTQALQMQGSLEVIALRIVFVVGCGCLATI